MGVDVDTHFCLYECVDVDADGVNISNVGPDVDEEVEVNLVVFFR